MKHDIFANRERPGCGHHGGRYEEYGGPRERFEGGFGGGRGIWFESRGARHSGFGCDPRGRFERGFGGGRERLFDAGDVKLVILKLLSEQPSYGYQLIKTMEERLSGGYTPSAGIIYPTLTMLEEEGFASTSIADNNKKVYSVTPEGFEYLERNQERVAELFERLEAVGKRFQRGRSPEIMRAFMNLRTAMQVRMSRERMTRDQIRKIADAIDAAAKSIEEL